MAGKSGDRLELGPELINPFNDYSEEINMFIHIDANGIFTNQVYSNGKSYSIDEWNSMHQSKPAAKDFDDGDRLNNK